MQSGQPVSVYSTNVINMMLVSSMTKTTQIGGGEWSSLVWAVSLLKTKKEMDSEYLIQIPCSVVYAYITLYLYTI